MDTLTWTPVEVRDFISYEQFNEATGRLHYTIIPDREFDYLASLTDDGWAYCFGSKDHVRCFVLNELFPYHILMREEAQRIDLNSDGAQEFFFELEYDRGGYSENGNDSWGEAGIRSFILDTLSHRIVLDHVKSKTATRYLYEEGDREEQADTNRVWCPVELRKDGVYFGECNDLDGSDHQHPTPRGLFVLHNGVLRKQSE